MDEKLISILRVTRATLQTALGPIDWAARMLNNKHGYPPLQLRQAVGSLNDFEGSIGEYVTYLKLLCGLRPGHKLLDLGCGCGTILQNVTGAGPLTDYLGPNGRYVGLDIDKRAIKWCSKNLQNKYPIRQFITSIDGLHQYKFDAVLAKSLFTHLEADGVADYLALIKERLVPNGYCLATFFLINNDYDVRKTRLKFHHNKKAQWLLRKTRPGLGIAYDENFLLGLIKTSGLSANVWYGTWRGNGKGLSFQDIIVMRKQ